MNLVCFGHISWSPLMKRNQSMVYWLKKKGAYDRVLFVNPYVRLTDLALKYRMQTGNIVKVWSWKRLVPRTEQPGVIAITTLFAGPDRIFFPLNRLISLAYIAAIRLTACRAPFTLLINDFEPDREFFYRKLIPLAREVIVDISDDFLHFGEAERKTAATRRIIGFCCSHARLVLCVNDHLRRKFGDGSGKYLTFRNGFNLDPAFDAGSPIDPFRERSIPRPVIGYMGVISDARIDHELMRSLLDRFGGCSFVFLGQDIGGLCDRYRARYPHFFHIPAVPYGEMLRLCAGFDVAIIPHLVNEHTAGNDLLKTHIFMALRVPLVSTPASGIAEFADSIDVAHDADAFGNMVAARLRERDDARLRRGQARAMEHAWDTRIDGLLAEIRSRGMLE